MSTEVIGFRLSPQQKHLWLLQQGSYNPAYRTECAVRIAGELDQQTLAAAIRNVVERHEILRTVFHFLPGVDVPLQVIGNEPVLETVLESHSSVAHTLTISLPAACMDSAGVVNLVREIAASLEGSADGEQPLQYADLSKWQNDLLEGAEGREFWREREVKGVSSSLAFAPRRFAASLPGTESTAFLLACWQVLLWKLSGESRVVVGAAFAGRSYPELAGALGLFTRYLPLTAELQGEQRFAAVVSAAAAQLQEAAEWQEYFSWPSERSYCAYAFADEEQPESFRSGAVQWQIEAVQSCVERYQVKLQCRRRETGVELEWHYDSAVVTEAAVARLAEQFQTLVQSARRNPETPLAHLEMVSAAERVQLIEEWNRTAVDYAGAAECLHEQFAAQAARTPEAVAVVYEGAALTYAELEGRANQLARYLQAQGVGPETVVGLLQERSLELVVSLLGVLKAGAAYLPLDAGYPEARLRYMLKDAGVRVLLTEPELLARVGAADCEVVCVGAEWARIAECSAAPVVSSVSAANVAYVIYTSGSTGQPKGVMITHAAISNHMQWMQQAYGLQAEDAVLQKTPFSFDASVWEFYAPLLSGARLVMARPGGHQDSQYLVRVMQEEQVSILQGVPSLLRLLASEAGLSGCGLRRVFSGGERLAVELAAQLWERLPGVELINLYGPTEATIDATYWQCEAGADIPIGRAVANLQTFIVDERQELAPVGVRGELLLGGLGLARGYLNAADKTAEKFIPNPFSDVAGARLYRTGDEVRYRVDGVIEYLGRRDQQVKLRGYRIELEEIEVKLRAHAAVKDVVVLVREERLVGYVVASGEISVSELRQHLQGALPDYMIPAAWVFLKTLPLTPNGKLDKRALPAPDESRPDLETPFVKPRTEAEQALANIWADVLGVDHVGIFDNFFELGGDSILGIQIVARANQVNIRLTPRQLFQYQTIAALQDVAELAPIVQAEQGIVTGPAPLTPIQEWFFDSAFAEPHHFNQSFLFEVPAHLDATVLEKSVGALLQHHDALRMRFSKTAQGWTQTNAGFDYDVPFSHEDLSGGSETSQRAALETRANELQRSLDLSDGPLLQVALFERGSERPNWLLIVIHHLVVDGVSWRILLDDLQLCYEQLGRGENVRLPPKTTSYKQWAERLQAQAQTYDIEREAEYWEDEARVFEALPVDFAGGDNLKSSARTVSVSLNEEETRRLLQDVPRVYNTQINDLLLAALLETYRQWTGRHSLLIDLEGHGREEIFDDVDLSRTVGWFTTLYPVQLEMTAGDGWEQIIKRVKEHLRAIPNNGIGYGLLKYLNPTSIQTGTSAEVNFNYLGQFDGAVSGSSLVRLAQESSGAVYSPHAKRSYLLEINGIVVHGKLQVGWTYGAELYQRETVTGLAQSYIEALRSLIQHCLSQKTSSFTASDFAEFKWSQAHLDEIAAALDQARQV